MVVWEGGAQKGGHGGGTLVACGPPCPLRSSLPPALRCRCSCINYPKLHQILSEIQSSATKGTYSEAWRQRGTRNKVLVGLHPAYASSIYLKLGY